MTITQEELLKKLECLNSEIERCEKTIYEAEDDKLKATELFGVFLSNYLLLDLKDRLDDFDIDLECYEFIAPGSWKCDEKKNPIRTCIYEDVSDPCNDECLYCGQPRERK